MLTIADLTAVLADIAPLSLAADWDNVGLLLGDPAAPVERVMTCLTVTPESAREAIDEKAQLIVSHHPILFRPVKKLTAASAEGRMLLGLLHAGIAVYSPHTAFDNAPGGINDLLAKKLGLTGVLPLRRGESAKQCKLAVFVPDKDLAKVSDAMFDAGAGRIGQYRECSFRLAGTGTFFGTDSTNPTVGEKGRREDVAEWRLEVICPEANVERVISALRAAHSYEEPAYDIYTLRPERSNAGEGRLGTLASLTTLQAFGQVVKSALQLANLQIVGAPDRTIERVAIACGAAGEFLADALRANADVFVTGEVRFHDMLAAEAQSIALLLPGHYATERLGIESLAERLRGEFPTLHVWPSQREKDPLAFA